MTAPKTFGSVLRNLLLTSGLYHLSVWANALKASPGEVISWTRDEAYPTPAQLAIVLDMVRGMRPEKLEEWDQVSHLPLRDFVLLVHLLPISYRCVPNLAMYALWDEYEEFLARMAKLPSKEQRDLLKYAREEVLAEVERSL